MIPTTACYNELYVFIWHYHDLPFPLMCVVNGMTIILQSISF